MKLSHGMGTLSLMYGSGSPSVRRGGSLSFDIFSSVSAVRRLKRSRSWGEEEVLSTGKKERPSVSLTASWSLSRLK